VKDASVIKAALLTGALVISIATAPAGQAAGVQDCAGGKKPDVAIEVCSVLLKNKALAVYRVSAYAGRAKAYMQKKQFDKAIADFDRALELKPDNPALYYQRAEAFLQKGNDQRAIEDLTAAILLKPSFRPATFPAEAGC
jgi:tetratricopeptide (TPR) repeat protein